jgi:tripartite-type tricarboxylate transporter receptor subunit TctC
MTSARHSSSRRWFIAAAASAWLVPMIASAQASYPARTITLIIPYAAGGPADAMARVLADQLQTRLKQTVIVDSKAGGAATIGTGFVARAQPDGYTLLMSTSAGHVVTPLMQRTLYDGVDDFAFISIVANQPNVLVAHPSLEVSTLKELLALAAKEPGKLYYASAGAGGATHLGAEALWQKAGVKITHVPYGGAAPALKDLLAGEVKLGMLNLAATQPFIEKGALKALAYGGTARAASLPSVPTLAESGFGGTEVSTWYSLAAPKGTPPDVIALLSKVMKDIDADPAYQSFMASQGAERKSLSPAETTAFVRQDKEAMAKLLGSLDLLVK